MNLELSPSLTAPSPCILGAPAQQRKRSSPFALASFNLPLVHNHRPKPHSLITREASPRRIHRADPDFVLPL